MAAVPSSIRLFHIVHVDRLPSIIADGQLWCDARMAARAGAGTTIGMGSIKDRRLRLNELASHPGLFVGQCVPFYFCPRSVMLYVISCRNHPELSYTGGQDPIVHLVADLHDVVGWADGAGRRWAFTLGNAGARYFEDRADLAQLDEIDWEAVEARQWAGAGVSSFVKEAKQAEFLVEEALPWHLIRGIGVWLRSVYGEVEQALRAARHKPAVKILPNWYY